jgi:hypothetical protein
VTTKDETRLIIFPKCWRATDKLDEFQGVEVNIIDAERQVAIASGEMYPEWGFTSVRAGCCAGGGGRPRLYGYGSPLRMKVISLAQDKSTRCGNVDGDMHSPLYRVR